jgi:hypothetical protein
VRGLIGERGHPGGDEQSAHEEGHGREGDEHVDAACRDEVRTKAEAEERDRAHEAGAIRTERLEEAPHAVGAEGDRQHERCTREHAHPAEDERPGESEDAVPGHAGRAGADADRAPRREEVAPRHPPRVERRKPTDEREMGRDEVAHADREQQGHDDHGRDLGPERREESDRDGCLATPEVVELVEALVVAERGAETDGGVGHIGLRGDGRGLGRGERAARGVHPLVHEPRSERREARGSGDLQAPDVVVVEDAHLRELLVAPAYLPGSAEAPPPRADDRADALAISPERRDHDLTNLQDQQQQDGRQQVEAPVAREHRRQPVASGERLEGLPAVPGERGGERPSAGRQKLVVRDHCVGAHDHP